MSFPTKSQYLFLGNPFFDIVGGASVPYGDSFLIVGGYSYEVDTDYVDLVHFYDPESGSIIPLDGRLKNKKEVCSYNNCELFYGSCNFSFIGCCCTVGKAVEFPRV